MVICLEQGADLHITQLMSLSLTVLYFSKIQIGFTFLVPAHLGSPRKRAVKRVCVCVCVCVCVRACVRACVCTRLQWHRTVILYRFFCCRIFSSDEVSLGLYV